MQNIGFKISFGDGSSLNVFFPVTTECVLTVNDNITYHFRISNKKQLEVNQYIKIPLAGMMELKNSILRIEEIVEETVYERDELLRTRVKCRGKEYSIFGGYALTPCGYVAG